MAMAAAIATFALAIYAGALRNGFVYDDIPQVVQNPWIRDASSLLAAFTSDAWGYLGIHSNYYRPMMHVVYAAANALFGLDARGFHLLNLLLHAAVSVLVYATSLLVLRAAPGASPARSRVLAAASGFLFAAHPIHTEVVSWISATTDLCVALLALSALHAYATLPPERVPSASPRYLWAVIAFAIATLTKEVALVIPGILVAWDVSFRRHAVVRVRWLAAYAPFAGVIGLYFLLRWSALGGFASISRHQELTTLQLALNVCALFGAYLAKLVVPSGLSAFHPFDPVVSIADPRALAGLVALALVVAFVSIAWRRRSGAVLVALAVLLLPLLPSLWLTRLGENPFAERYLYLPSLGFIWLLAIAGQRLVAARPRLAPALGAAAVVLCATWAWGVAARQPAWRDDVSLWSDAAAKAPGAAIPRYNLAVALEAAGDLPRAIAEYETALRLEESPVAWTSLGAAYHAAGRDEDALRAYGRALYWDAANVTALNGLGATYVKMGRGAAAIEPLRAAIGLAPRFAPAYHNLGLAYEQLGDSRAAIESYRAALGADPSSAASYQRLRALTASP